jgi:hypothetical protein
LKEELVQQKQKKEALEVKLTNELDLQKRETEALEVKLTATEQDLENNKKAVANVCDEKMKVVERLKQQKDMNKLLRKEIAARTDPETKKFVANQAGN